MNVVIDDHLTLYYFGGSTVAIQDAWSNGEVRVDLRHIPHLITFLIEAKKSGSR